MRLVSWPGTDTGKKRDHNEDSYLADDALGLWAVADGMGGHQGGGHASRLALEVLRREVAAAADDFAAAALAIVERRGKNGAGAKPESDMPTQETIGDDDTLDGSEDKLLERLRTTGPVIVQRPTPQPLGEQPTDRGVAVLPPIQLVMASAAQRAGEEIYDAAQAHTELQGMGTTLTAILHRDGVIHYAHAGDSRVYLFRDGKLRQITEDHSWIWEQIKSGAMSEAEARTSKFRHIITRSVGFERALDVDTGAVEVQAGDCFLLCSDGMSNYLRDDELERILDATWFRRAPHLLIDIANDRGGDDNITIVVVFASNDEG